MERPGLKEECMIPDEGSGVSPHLEHVARYRLAARFAARKRVLDGATGLGHGAVILAQAGAAEVTGIDADSQAEQRDAHYGSQRYDKGKLERTLIRFHEKHGLFIDEEDLYPYLGYPNSEAFIERALAGRGGRA